MKRAFFAGLMIFSLLVNASVGVVIARHLWHEKKYNTIESRTECPALSSERPEDFEKAGRVIPRWEQVDQAQTPKKKGRSPYLIASNPGNLEPVQSAIHELIKSCAVFGKSDIGTHKPDDGLSSSRKAYGFFGVSETQNL